MRFSATSRNIVPSLSDTPSLPPRTQTPLCLFSGAKRVQIEGKGVEGGEVLQGGICGWRDGGAKEGDRGDSDLHRLMKRDGGKKVFFA